MKDERRIYRSTYDRLRAEGFAPEQALQIRAKVSVSENGKRYHLKTNGQEESAVFGVDGYIVKEGAKCDKLVLVKQPNGNAQSEQWTEIFVELKGVDTSHAIEQLWQTLSKSIFRHPSNNDIRARIVAQSFPSNKSNPTMERAKQEFRQKFRCDLRGMKAGQEDRL